ncbi:MAG: hypothetical protein IKM31_01670 [Oscillospiraceae bacterium]|nr:hypothetical protein [Oscillospiraceae bacterium]
MDVRKLLIPAAAAVLLAGGCMKRVETDYAAPDLGITLTVKDVTAAGLTVVCDQAGGEVTGELLTGSWYRVESLESGAWTPLEYVPEGDVAWDSVAYPVMTDGRTEWPVDWEWLYGGLMPGEYRICKEFMDLREPGDFDRTLAFAEFTIE